VQELDPINRYGDTHLWGRRKFILTEFHPQEDECKFLLMKVIEQSIRDFINLEKCIAPIEIQHFESARDFLFDDEYRIHYGEGEIGLEDVLHILSLDIDWFREKVTGLKVARAEVPELSRSMYRKTLKKRE
jgi:hypothetical protein